MHDRNERPRRTGEELIDETRGDAVGTANRTMPTKVQRLRAL
jgi:hypothetical protein